MAKAKQPLQIATIEDFDNTEVVQLPSQEGTNKAVRLQKPDLVQLFADGEAPDLLSSIALNNLGNGTNKPNVSIDKDNLPDLMKTLDFVCRLCFLEPQLGNNEGELPLHKIQFNDKMFVFMWALGAEYQPARQFPDETRENMDDLQPVNGVSEETE